MFRMLEILMVFRYCFIVFCLRQSKLELRGESWVLHSVDHSSWWYCYKRPDFTDSFRFHVTEGTLQSHWKGISSQELEMAYEYKLLVISFYLKCPSFSASRQRWVTWVPPAHSDDWVLIYAALNIVIYFCTLLL